MKISFILVEPAVPENIGSAARAINTMGFSDLRLVNPDNKHLADEAKWLAHGSSDVLESATVYSQFTDAIHDLDFVVGTTAKKRSVKHDYYSPEKAKQIVIDKKGAISHIGIVFGREESGLKNEELLLCDIATTIPLSKPYPSINLAQSVMLYAYIFSDLQSQDSTYVASECQDRLHHELKANAKQILVKLNIDSSTNLHHRIMERIATSNEDDVRLFLSFAKKFKQEFESNQI